MTDIRSITVEFHRLGDPRRALSAGERYIRTVGVDERASEHTMPIGQPEFDDLIAALRYLSEDAEKQAAQARLELMNHGLAMLKDIPLGEGRLQLDLVASAAELWAFPFEAVLAHESMKHVVLTRRIRGEYATRSESWPATPKLLFLHAPEAPDLSAGLIAEHERALHAALRPWCTAELPAEECYARRSVRSAEEIEKAVTDFEPTHVHVLAHGKETSDAYNRRRRSWGVRLGGERERATPPEAVASALAPSDAPVVVSLAACDSANVGDSAYGFDSLAQMLHRKGVPLVIASQLPLTMAGSVTLARAIYTGMLRGVDVREALHDARSELKDAHDAGHDWLSLVAFVRLPERYADHVLEVRLRAELAMMNAAQRAADALGREGAAEANISSVIERLRAHLDSLEECTREAIRRFGAHAPVVGECQGLVASANKRLSDLFLLRREPDQSRTYLKAARDAYRDAYRENRLHHWCGIQQLALEAALDGKLSDESDWRRVHAAAELCGASVGRDPRAFWAYGTLAEVLLLGPFAGQPADLAGARAALTAFVTNLPSDDTDAIASTIRQLNRYVQQWTVEQGYFPGVRHDIRVDAANLVQHLVELHNQTRADQR